jgi:SAM-dependent methyltransferase
MVANRSRREHQGGMTAAMGMSHQPQEYDLSFAGTDGAVYDQHMGRWSRVLATPFIDFAAIDGTGRFMDVGCGTGSLVFALAAAAPRARIVGIDTSQAYIDFARARAQSAATDFQRADATALPFGDGDFDAALSLLVLNFIPEAERAVREMVRVTRPGGVVAASVWDFRGGLCYLRVLQDTAAALDPAAQELRDRLFSSPLTAPGELFRLWSELGLRDVEHTSLTIRMEFRSFSDYWEPWLGGQGLFGPYVASLEQDKRRRLERLVQLAYLAGGDDGPRSFAATSWAVRGVR